MQNFNFHIHFNNNRCRFKDLSKIVFELPLFIRVCFMNPMDNFRFEIGSLKKTFKLEIANG